MGVPRTRTQASKSAKCLPRPRMAGREAPDRKLHKLVACSESSRASESPSGSLSPYQCGPVHSLARTVRPGPRLPLAGAATCSAVRASNGPGQSGTSRIVYLVRLISIWYCIANGSCFPGMTLDMPDEGTRGR